MNFFRTHITRIWSTVLLLAGIFMHQGAAANNELQQDLFDQWLEWQLTSGDSGGVLQQLADLGYDELDMDQALEDASRMIRSGEDASDENSSNDPDQKVIQVLLSEWNDFNKQNQGMGKAVLIEQAKSSAITHQEALQNFSKVIIHVHNAQQPLTATDVSITGISFSYVLSPLTGGIAIGAP